MKSNLLSLLIAASVVYLLVCLYLYFLQRSLIYFPTPARDAAAERLFVDSDGVRLLLWRLHAERRDAVLYFGGNAEDVALNIPAFREWFAGCAVYLVNYRGYGGSAGKPRESALYRDAETVFDAVRETHAQVTVIGRSLGSAVATRLAASRPVDRLVLVTPPASFTRLAGDLYPFFPTGLLLADKFDSLSRAHRIDAPVLLLVAEHDEIVPPDHSFELAGAIDASLLTTRVIERAGHNTIDSSPAYGKALRSFVCGPAT